MFELLAPAVEADGVEVDAADVACGEGVVLAVEDTVGPMVAVSSAVGLTGTGVGVDTTGAVAVVGTVVGLEGFVGGTAAFVRVGAGLTGVPAGCPIGPGYFEAAALTAL